MKMTIAKPMKLVGILTIAVFWLSGCDWESESRDAGMNKAIEFHSTSKSDPSGRTQVAAVEEPDIELVAIEEGSRTAVDAEEPERSEQLMEIAFEHVDEQPVDHVAVAREHLGKKDFAAALVELGKAVYDKPQDYAAAVLLGKTALRSGEIDLAKKALSLAKEMDPQQADAWILLGRIAIKEKNLNRATDHARQAMSVDSRRAESHNLMGRIWLAKSHWERAIASFRKAVSLDPDSLYYRNNLGLAWLMKKNYDQAVQVLEQVVARGGVTAFMHNNLGLAYEGAGRLQEAISEFKTAVEMNPSYINAQVNLDRMVTLAKRAEEEIEPVPAILEEPNDGADDLIIVEPEGN